MATRSKGPGTRAEPTTLGLAGIGSVKEILLAAFTKADTAHIAVMAICGIGTVLGLVVCVAMTMAGQYGVALSAFAISIVLLVFGLAALWPSASAEIAKPVDVAQHARVMWSRRVPRVPIPEDSVETLRRSVEAARNQAFRWLNEQDATIRPEEVRANIFFPYCVDAPAADVCALRIPPGLQSGMDEHPDIGITLRPGQGLTGDVFRTGEPKVAETVVDKEGVHAFTDLHQLTAKQKEQAHPDLRWIVSLPLTIPSESGARRCGAVLNVDGLRHQIGAPRLKLLCASLLPNAAQLSDTLASLPGLMIRITHQEV